MGLTIKNFFRCYIFNTCSVELTQQDQCKAKALSIAIGILFVGIIHLACLPFYNRKFKIINSQDVNPQIIPVAEKILSPPAGLKKPTPLSPLVLPPPKKNSPKITKIELNNHQSNSSHSVIKNEDIQYKLEKLRLMDRISDPELFESLVKDLIPQLPISEIYKLDDRQICQSHHWHLLSYGQAVELLKKPELLNHSMWLQLRQLPCFEKLLETLSRQQVYEFNTCGLLEEQDWVHISVETFAALDFTQLQNGDKERLFLMSINLREKLISTFSPEEIKTYIEEKILFKTKNKMYTAICKYITWEQISKIDFSTIPAIAFEILFSVKEKTLSPAFRFMKKLSMEQLCVLQQRNFLTSAHWSYCSTDQLKAFIFSEKNNIDKATFEMICPVNHFEEGAPTNREKLFSHLLFEEFQILVNKGFIYLNDWSLLSPTEIPKLDFELVDSQILKNVTLNFDVAKFSPAQLSKLIDLGIVIRRPLRS